MTAVGPLAVLHSHVRKLTTLLFTLAFLSLATPSVDAVVIDFEALPEGHALQSSDWPPGTTLSVDNARSNHPDLAIVFDSDCTVGNCSGKDDDLRTPGKGIGNTTPHGKIMIIAEDDVDNSPADGLVDDPDDEIGGGVITLTFAQPYKLLAVHGIIDFQPGEEPSEIQIDPADGSATQVHTIPTLGDNSASDISLPAPVAASEVRFVFGGSGGLDEISLIAACGDGLVDPGEECDDGAANSDTDPDACRSNCTLPICGDNVVDSGEQCDPPDGIVCDATCNPVGPPCGDGIVDPGEECDDGAANSDTDPDACRTDCMLPFCGDTTVDTGEQCDPPDGVTCGSACESLVCGNGVLDPGEECDDGAANSDIDPDACRTNCTLPFCGDDVTDTGEECDPPDGSTCEVDCTLIDLCGNGVVDPDEECDPPDGVTCDDQCRFRCGNGVVDPGEACDPGGGEICDNLTDDDGDGQIDCHDSECSLTETSCNEVCQPVGQCKFLKRDPAVIKFKGNGLDRFNIHARVDAEIGDFDPNEVGFGIALYNDDGVIHQAFVPPGAFSARGIRNGFPTRYRFKDKSARRLGEDSMAGGIYRANMRFRRVCSEPSYTAQIEFYADLSEATTARMTTQYYSVGDIGSLTAEWARKPADTSRPLRGWKLTLANIPGSDNPGSCQ